MVQRGEGGKVFAPSLPYAANKRMHSLKMKCLKVDPFVRRFYPIVKEKAEAMGDTFLKFLNFIRTR